MEGLQGFAAGAVLALKAFVLLALPVAAAGVVLFVLRRLAPDGYFAVPLTYTLSRWVGLGFGLSLVYVHLDQHYFDLHEIFVAGGPWDIGFAEFLSERVNPVDYGPLSLIAALATGDDTPLTVAVLALALLGLSAIAWSWRTWPPPEAWRATAAVVLTMLAAAYMTIYAVALLFWLLFLFNSWTFLLLVLVLHYYRRPH